MNSWAPAGKLTKYARPERERRFLLSAVPPGEVVRRAAITDRYLPGTRLRLRRTVETTAGGTTVVHKFGRHRSGGRLVTTTRDELRRVLAEFGLPR